MVQYRGHVDTNGNVTGWGSFEHTGKPGHYANTGTFLNNKLEGIVVSKMTMFGATDVLSITIQECHMGDAGHRSTVYVPDKDQGGYKFAYSTDCKKQKRREQIQLDIPYFSIEGEPLEAYYKVQEFW